MMRMRTKAPAFPPIRETTPTVFAACKLGGSVGGFDSGSGGGSPAPEDVEWEVRPCGMLVQKRNPDAAAAAAGCPPAPHIRVRVKYGSAYYDVYLSSQATFGELKKLVSERTGVHPQDQKLLYKDKERESSAFLDMSGVKDKSKVVLVEDPAAQARRFLEMRRAATTEKAAKSISQITLDVDKLASQVSALEKIVSEGKKVAESDVVRLIEQLMDQLLKLDGVVADGDVKLQRRMQVMRVQKYVETLDVLKIKNSSIPVSNGKQQQQQHNNNNNNNGYKYHQSQPTRVVLATKDWEMFDLLSGPSTSAAATTISTASTTTAAATAAAPTPRFDWELF